MLARKKPFTRPPNLVPKPTGLSSEDKGPARNERHLAFVRSLPCLVCPDGRQQSPTRAHHPRGLFLRTTGVRISDMLVLPLCDGHHTDGPDALHRGGDEAGWWRRHGVEPYGAILSILAGSRDPDREEAIALVKLARERAHAEGVT